MAIEDNLYDWIMEARKRGTTKGMPPKPDAEPIQAQAILPPKKTKPSPARSRFSITYHTYGPLDFSGHPELKAKMEEEMEKLGEGCSGCKLAGIRSKYKTLLEKAKIENLKN